MKKLIGISLGILVVAVPAALYFLGVFPSTEDGNELAEGETGENGKALVQSTPLYLPLEPPFIVNFTHRGTLRYLQVTLELMYHDQALLDKVTRRMPEIRNELILLFSDQEYEELSTLIGKQELRAEIMHAINYLIDNEHNNEDSGEVYITSFVMQ